MPSDKALKLKIPKCTHTWYEKRILAQAARIAELEAENARLREGYAELLETGERLYDTLKAKAGDIDLKYALRAFNAARKALAGASDETAA